MLYGTMPFKGRDTRTLIEAIEIGKISKAGATVSGKTQTLLKDMLRPEPEDRI